MRPPRFAEAPLYMGTLKAGQLRYLRYPHSRCTRCWLRLRVCSPRTRCVRTCGPGAGCYCSPVDFPQIILCAGYDFGHPALDEIPLKKAGRRSGLRTGSNGGHLPPPVPPAGYRQGDEGASMSRQRSMGDSSAATGPSAPSYAALYPTQLVEQLARIISERSSRHGSGVVPSEVQIQGP